jgi:two-component system, LytTR family, sensor kinase
VQIGVQKFSARMGLTVLGLILCFCFIDILHNYIGGMGEGLHLSRQYLFFGIPAYWFTYFAVLPLAIFLAGRYRIDLLSRRSILVHLGGALVFCYVHIVMIAAIPIIRINPDTSFETMLFRQLRGNFAMDFLSYWAVVVTFYAVRYHSELQQREVAAAQLEAGLAQAHLQVLQAQLRPHFFFNTLQAISVLALKGDKDGVVETLAHLSNLLRVTFDSKRPQKIALALEIEFLDEYLAIERLSLGDRLNVVRDIRADVLNAMVPSMVLQLLVENAIVHGIANRPGAGTIAVAVAREGDMLVLTVSDSGPGFQMTADRHGGVGLTNTRARLDRLYGDSYRLEFGLSAEGGAVVTIAIPLERSGGTAVRRSAQALAS